MKLYTSVGPNPRIVRMFMMEKGITLDEQWIDIIGGENCSPAFMAMNPAGQTPVLEVGPETFISETVAICEYLDETGTGPRLAGETALERADVRMWTRRVEIRFCHPLSAAFRYGPALKMFEKRVYCIPFAADEMARMARAGAVWLDGLLADRPYIAGEKFSLADIVLYCFVDFAARKVSMPIDTICGRLRGWFERVDARASAQETADVAYGRTIG